MKQIRFCIGICATGLAGNLVELLMLIRREFPVERGSLGRVIVVASECSQEAVEFVREFTRLDRRFVLIEEKRRYGKADAINKILGCFEGDFLIFINSDALPEAEAIDFLLKSTQADDRIGVASACPFFEVQNTLTSQIEHLMWWVHNESSLQLNHAGLNNHASDEMMIVRSDVLHKLPQGIVNDGAFIAATAKLDGYSVKFWKSAGVKIDVPSRIVDLIQQRRRIIFGHFQIWKLFGRPPKTVESMLLNSPITSLKLAVKILSRFPELIIVLPFALASEFLSLCLAMLDVSKSTTSHGIWKRYGN